MSETTEKPRLTSAQVEVLVQMHNNETVPQRLRPTLLQLLGMQLICAGDRGWVLTYTGKRIARHLTARA